MPKEFGIATCTVLKKCQRHGYLIIMKRCQGREDVSQEQGIDMDGMPKTQLVNNE